MRRFSLSHHGTLYCGSLAFVLNVLTGCGSSRQVEVKDSASAPVQPDGVSLCGGQASEEVEIVETAPAGRAKGSIRRVYRYVDGPNGKQRVLWCREVDSNIDGRKDIVRFYDKTGAKLSEKADANYDGSIDTWISFGPEGPEKVKIDKNRDGKPDEVRYYSENQLVRVERDTNGDAKADHFETYRAGRLERIGLDTDYDGSVDVWHRDSRLATESAENTEADQESAEKEGDTESAQQE